MIKTKKFKIIAGTIILFGCFFVFSNYAFATTVVKQANQPFVISVTCTDTDANLSKCEIIAPASFSKTCNASGASGTCSANAMCSEPEYSTKGRATDTLGLTTDVIGPTVICDNLPVADAGPGKEVFEGEREVLEGSATDADGDYLAYSWSCNGGSLSNANILRPEFISSSVLTDQVYTCTLTVTDSKGGVASDSTTVTVKNTVLNISLEADKTVGNSPLLDVSLTANVLPSSTARGTTADYYFWCNCSYAGTNINTAIFQCENYNKSAIGADPNSYIADKVCDYIDADGGTFTPKVIVNKGYADSAQATTLVTIGEDTPPTVSDLSMSPPPPGCPTDCSLCNEIPPLTPILTWRFNDNGGDYQTAFEILFTDEDDNVIRINSNERNGSSQSYVVENGVLSYSKIYQWKIRVADSAGVFSPWVSYGGTYATPAGSFPSPDFSFSPTKPEIGKDIKFTDESTPADAEIVKWEWFFPNASLPDKDMPENPLILEYSKDTYVKNQTVVFYVKDKNQKASLKVTDANGLTCTVEKSLEVSSAMPKWREIIPW